MKQNLYFASHTKINSNGLKMNIRPKTVELLEENMGEIFVTLDLFTNGFSDMMTPEALTTKEKIDIFDIVNV